MAKFTEILKENNNNDNSNDLILSFKKALSNLSTIDAVPMIELHQTVKTQLSSLSDEIDSFDFDIQNINNDLSQEILNQKKQQREVKIKQRDKTNQIYESINNILPTLKNLVKRINNVKTKWA